MHNQPDLFTFAEARSPKVIRSADCETSSEGTALEAIALAMMGVGRLAPERFAEGAIWDRTEGARTGRDAICAALAEIIPASKIRIEQIAIEGRSGSVSGRITRGAETKLFCHMIRFTSAAANQIAQVVSFEHPVPRPPETHRKGA